MRRIIGALGLFVVLAAACSSSAPPLTPAEPATASPEPSPTARYTIETPVPPTPTQPFETAPPTLAPTPPPTVAPTVAPQVRAADLCGAPSNPWGFNVCGRGGYITSPPADFCSYFSCIPNFPNWTGYVIECVDHMYSKSGGHQGSCSHHGGDNRPLYGGP